MTEHQCCSFLEWQSLLDLYTNFGVIAVALHEATKGPDNEPLKWTEETNHAYKTLIKALIEVPALGIPSLAKPFLLYLSEKKKGIAG
jgi:hypothetical protein